MNTKCRVGGGGRGKRRRRERADSFFSLEAKRFNVVPSGLLNVNLHEPVVFPFHRHTRTLIQSAAAVFLSSGGGGGRGAGRGGGTAISLSLSLSLSLLTHGLGFLVSSRSLFGFPRQLDFFPSPPLLGRKIKCSLARVLFYLLYCYPVLPILNIAVSPTFRPDIRPPSRLVGACCSDPPAKLCSLNRKRDR